MYDKNILVPNVDKGVPDYIYEDSDDANKMLADHKKYHIEREEQHMGPPSDAGRMDDVNSDEEELLNKGKDGFLIMDDDGEGKD